MKESLEKLAKIYDIINLMAKSFIQPKEKAIQSHKQRSKDFPAIKKAVSRAVKEYGETLKKLAKDDS